MAWTITEPFNAFGLPDLSAVAERQHRQTVERDMEFSEFLDWYNRNFPDSQVEKEAEPIPMGKRCIRSR